MRFGQCSLLALSAALLSGNVIAQTEPAPGASTSKPTSVKSDDAGIAVDESNFKAIFDQTLDEVDTAAKTGSSRLNIEVNASYVSISKLELSNAFFTVDYAKELKSIPSLQFVGSKKYAVGRWGLEPSFSMGYGTRAASLQVRSPQNTLLTDYISVHWIPLSAGLRTSHAIPGLKVLTAFLTPAIGSQYIYQSGQLDGIDQGFWIPYVAIRSGLSLFERDRLVPSSSAWFDGIALSGTLFRGLSSTKPMLAWSLDLGLRVLL